MPAPTDINSQIALRKGWTWDEKPWFRTKPGAIPHYDRWLEEDLIEKKMTHWINPERKPAIRPDFVGTLEGVAGLMRELQARRKPMSQWAWYWNDKKQRFVMRHAAWLRRFPFRRQVHAIFYSPKDRPAHCVGEAWLAMMEEHANVSTE